MCVYRAGHAWYSADRPASSKRTTPTKTSRRSASATRKRPRGCLPKTSWPIGVLLSRPPGKQLSLIAPGYKFETLCLLQQPWDPTSREEIESREDQVVNNCAQYCSIVRTGIGPSRLIIGGEVDAVWDCKPERKEDPIHWVELKTSAEIRSDRDMLKYERKLLKFWAQSFLLGVPKIIVGFRDQNGIVHRLEELETASIPGKVKKVGRGSWDGNVCINFAAAFLDCMSS